MTKTRVSKNMPCMGHAQQKERLIVQRIKDKNFWNRALCGKSTKLGMHL